MPTVNAASLRAQLDDCRARFDDIKRKGGAGAETLALIDALFLLLDVLVAVLLEKATPKTSSNSGLPPYFDGTGRRLRVSPALDPAAGDLKASGDRYIPGNLRTVSPFTEASTVAESRQLRRTTWATPTRAGLHEFPGLRSTWAFETVDCRVAGAFKDFPAVRHPEQGAVPRNHAGAPAVRTRHRRLRRAPARRPDGPAQADRGHDPGDDRAAALRGHASRLRLAPAPGPWRPGRRPPSRGSSKCPCRPSTRPRCGWTGRNHWIHVCSGGPVTVKRLHRKRGCEAIDGHRDHPPVHGRHRPMTAGRRTSPTPTVQAPALRFSHLLRELQAVTDSNGWPWAERMRKLLLVARRQVMRRADRRLSMRHYRRIARCYGEILEQGRKEMPEIPKRKKGRRGPVAKSDAHNLLERLAAQRGNVLRFARRADTPFSNNRAERDFRMAKVKQKVSGCFRTVAFAHAYCRISSCLQTMAALGCNPLVAVAIALKGNAVDCLNQGIQ